MTQLADSPTPQQQDQMPLLLAYLQTYFGKSSGGKLGNCSASDWQMLTQTAIANGVMPLLYQTLKRMKPSSILKSHLLQLQHLYRLNGLHNVSQAKELLRVLNLMQTAGIKAIAFKGPVLAAYGYGNVALRQFNDLDLLVRLEDFWKAMAVLTTHGYRSDYSGVSESNMFVRHLQIPLLYCDNEATLLNRHFQSSLLHSNPERSLDLHWGIQPRRVWNADRFALLWQHQQSVTLMGQAIQTLAPEATLVVLCMSIAREIGKRSLKQICDVAQTIQAHPELNWQAALKLATELRCQRLFLLGLSITQALLKIPIPDSLQLKVPALQSSENEVFQDVAVNHPFTTEFVSQFKTLDRPWDSVFISIHYLRLLWMTSDRDLEVLPLPDRWFFFYYVFRPVRLLAKQALVLQSKLLSRY